MIDLAHVLSWFLVPLGATYLMITLGLDKQALERRVMRLCPACGRRIGQCACTGSRRGKRFRRGS